MSINFFNLEYVLMGVIEILFSIIVIIITMLISFKIFAVFTKEYDDKKEIEKNNIAAGIITATFLFCIGYALLQAYSPSLTTLRNTVFVTDAGLYTIISGIGLVILQLFITVLVSVLSLLLTIFLLTRISFIKNLKSILKNNIAVAIVISTVMIITILIISKSIGFLIEGLIPNIIFNP